jgi:hypothetical protein
VTRFHRTGGENLGPTLTVPGTLGIFIARDDSDNQGWRVLVALTVDGSGAQQGDRVAADFAADEIEELIPHLVDAVAEARRLARADADA